MYNTGYPTNRFQITDNSGASSDVLFTAPEGLNVPFFFVLSERGVPGQIYYGAAAELTPLLGASTFDPTSPYFNPSNKFAGTAMAGQGIEVMRLVDPAATTSTFALFLTVTSALLTQYVKDGTGARTIDGSGNYIPQTQANGSTQVTETGVILKWTCRKLAANEQFDSLVAQTVTDNGVSTTTYPIVAGKMTSPGSYGDRQGFMLYSTNSDDSTIAQSTGSVLYRFVPMALPSNVSTTASSIPDAFGATYNDVSFKPVAIYPGTLTNYAFNYILGSSYVDGSSGETLLPYDMHVYSDNVATIGAACLAVSPELGAIDPYLLDLISGRNLQQNLYDHVQIDPASSTVVNSAVINYADGGSDGDTSWANFDAMVASWLGGSDHGEFANVQQHPMTHFSDPGFSIATKMMLFNMLDLRDNFKIDVSTQDISLKPNTKAQDLSAGQALVFRAQMHPESTITGVGCMRVGVYAHASTLVDGGPYGGLVPFNYNRMIQRRNLDGGLTIKGSSGGFPNSIVTAFRKPNWVADDDNTQAVAWANCINTVRHATRVTIFYPALRTVYPNDTSILSDDEVSDRIIYMYKIARRIWAKYVGTREDITELYPLIEKDINNECAAAFASDNLRVKAKVFQTAMDKNLGYQISINLAVSGSPTLRTMAFNVDVDRKTA